MKSKRKGDKEEDENYKNGKVKKRSGRRREEAEKK